MDILDIIYNGSVGVLIVDNQGLIVWANRHYEEITSLDMKRLVGTSVELVPHMENVFLSGEETMLTAVRREKKTVNRIMSFKSDNDVIATTTPIFDESGEIKWLLYVLLDWDELSHLKKQLQRACEQSEKSRHYLQEIILKELLESHGIIARDKNSLATYETGVRIAQVDATVLILGETGTGKDRMAKFIHKSGARKEHLFVHVNCSAIPESLFESELFGYERGSFTGADRQGKMGLVEFANHGTLFLDEVAELPLSMQAKLLTVLQNRELTRIGGKLPRPVDVRVIAATNRELKSLVEQKRFREDLYYRLNVLELRIQPLRQRKNDILVFVEFFTDKFNQKYHFSKRISKNVMDIFLEYQWPGNVRELENLMERLIIMSPKDVIEVDCLPKEFCGVETFVPYDRGKTDLKSIMENVEAQIIRRTIEETESLQEAAKKLGIEISTLTKKKQKYGIYKKGKVGMAETMRQER